MTNHLAIAELDGLLACPTSAQPLTLSGQQFVTAEGGTTYPLIDGIPHLVPEPKFAIGEWQARWQMELARLSGLAKPTHKIAPDERPYRAAVNTYIGELRSLLNELLRAPSGDLSSYLALRTRLPQSVGLLSYEHNVHRDWLWGDAENRQSAELIGTHFNEPERVLVLGSGAGRLAYDLHQQHGQTTTVALDINPLLSVVAHRVSQGQSVSLHEFPIAPRYREDRAVARILTAPESRSGLHYLVADAFHAPFSPGQFDAVITPWFVDVVGQPYAVIARHVNRLLRNNGRWITFGSFAFDHTAPEFDVCVHDLPELHETLGFTNTVISEQRLPYMDCPNSRHGRLEDTVVLVSDKRADCAPVAAVISTPAWIVTADEPVPALPAFLQQAQTTKIHAYIMSLINGKRTIDDIAGVLEKQQLMTKSEAVGTLRGFFLKMWDEAQSGRSY